MDYRCMLTEAQLKVLLSFAPTPRRPRVDDMRITGGIICVFRHGLPWRDAPREYGSCPPLYSRWSRWSKKGLFVRMLKVLAERSAETRTLMVDSTCFKVSRTACNLRLKKKDRRIGKTPGGWNSKGHVLADALGRPMRVHLTGGQVSDYRGAKVLLANLPRAKVPVADRGYDSDRIRKLLKSRGIDHCIPPRRHRKKKIHYDREICRSRHKIENCLGRLKDLHWLAFRRDRCPDLFLSAIALAAVVLYWL